MGAYMNCEYQRLNPETGKYEDVDLDIQWNQSYGLYGWLADVRNYSAVKPLPYNVGHPSGKDAELHDTTEGPAYCDFVCWLDTKELFNADFDAEIEDRRISVQTGPYSWNGFHTCEPGLGTKTTLRKFLGEHTMNNIERLKENKIDRMIMYFS